MKGGDEREMNGNHGCQWRSWRPGDIHALPVNSVLPGRKPSATGQRSGCHGGRAEKNALLLCTRFGFAGGADKFNLHNLSLPPEECGTTSGRGTTTRQHNARMHFWSLKRDYKGMRQGCGGHDAKSFSKIGRKPHRKSEEPNSYQIVYQKKSFLLIFSIIHGSKKGLFLLLLITFNNKKKFKQQKTTE